MKITDIPFRPKILSCMKSYSRSSFFADLNAGVSVGILALPLAMAFAIASGVAPEQGLYTAIVAGFIISVFGGSKVQIGGPTGAFIVVVAGIISQYGYGALAVATVMAGAILVAMGLAKMGNAIRYIPRPVTVGFTNGIAVLIMSTQIKDFLGLEMRNVPEDFIPKLAAIWENIHTADWRTLLVGVASAVIIVYWPKSWRRRVPGMIGAIFILTPLVALSGFDVETIRVRFGGIPSSLPSFAVPEFEFSEVKRLVMPAVTIAILAAIESLLSAVVADGMIDDKHDSNQELIAQGVANIAAPFFLGIPATGAIARTATNIKNGGRTRCRNRPLPYACRGSRFCRPVCPVHSACDFVGGPLRRGVQHGRLVGVRANAPPAALRRRRVSGDFPADRGVRADARHRSRNDSGGNAVYPPRFGHHAGDARGQETRDRLVQIFAGRQGHSRRGDGVPHFRRADVRGGGQTRGDSRRDGGGSENRHSAYAHGARYGLYRPRNTRKPLRKAPRARGDDDDNGSAFPAAPHDGKVRIPRKDGRGERGGEHRYSA